MTNMTNDDQVISEIKGQAKRGRPKASDRQQTASKQTGNQASSAMQGLVSAVAVNIADQIEGAIMPAVMLELSERFLNPNSRINKDFDVATNAILANTHDSDEIVDAIAGNNQRLLLAGK